MFNFDFKNIIAHSQPRPNLGNQLSNSQSYKKSLLNHFYFGNSLLSN